MSLTDITKLLWITSIIIWVLPPLRQYKGKLFNFFVIYAIIDPLLIIYGIITRANLPLWVIVLVAYLLIISILPEHTLKKHKYFFISLPLIFLLVIPFQAKKIHQILISLEHTVIVIIFLRSLIVSYVNDKKIKLFYLMLVFYELTNILKFSNLILGFSDAHAFYITTSIAQIAFGLYFSIVRED